MLRSQRENGWESSLYQIHVRLTVHTESFAIIFSSHSHSVSQLLSSIFTFFLQHPCLFVQLFAFSYLSVCILSVSLTFFPSTCFFHVHLFVEQSWLHTCVREGGWVGVKILIVYWITSLTLHFYKNRCVVCNVCWS